MLSILSAVILLAVLIFVHELGHFIAAKLSGVGVMKFSLGFGPRVLGKKIGETEYILSLVPLGGYVKLLGESEEETLPPAEVHRSFMAQNVWKRISIVLAGPIFNLFLAVIIFTFVYMWGIPVLTSKIGTVQSDSPASQAEMRAGDIVSSIDGKEVYLWSEMAEIISNSNGRALGIKLKRDNSFINITVQPTFIKVKNIFGEDAGSYKIGISPSSETVIEKRTLFIALIDAVGHTWDVSKLTVISVFKIIQGVLSPKTLGGPILIAQLAGAQIKEGLIPFILFMALLSVNLAVLNLLPIPVLDGGHILFYLIEVLIGKEINIKWRERAQQIGFTMLILLMLFVLLMDIARLNIPIITGLSDILKK